MALSRSSDANASDECDFCKKPRFRRNFCSAEAASKSRDVEKCEDDARFVSKDARFSSRRKFSAVKPTPKRNLKHFKTAKKNDLVKAAYWIRSVIVNQTQVEASCLVTSASSWHLQVALRNPVEKMQQ